MTDRFPPSSRAATWLLCGSLLAASAVQAQALRPSSGIARASDARHLAPARTADFIVALVNSEPITNNEVRQRLVRLEQQLTQQSAARAAARPARAPGAGADHQRARAAAARRRARHPRGRSCAGPGRAVHRRAEPAHARRVPPPHRRRWGRHQPVAQRPAQPDPAAARARARGRLEGARDRSRHRRLHPRAPGQQRRGQPAAQPGAGVRVWCPKTPRPIGCRRCRRAPRAWPTGPAQAATSPNWRASSPKARNASTGASSACARPTACPSCSWKSTRSLSAGADRRPGAQPGGFSRAQGDREAPGGPARCHGQRNPGAPHSAAPEPAAQRSRCRGPAGRLPPAAGQRTGHV